MILRPLRFFAIACSALLIAAQPAIAQDQAAPPKPWLYEGSDVPVDTAWTFGTLSNGLRYAVRRNGVPPNQMSIRVRIDAGSLMERENERGFAHLIEHLAFKQSRYLAEGEAIRAWQRLGASFGSDTNAETTPTQTVYKLDLPNINAAKLDETFKLLSGMIAYPTLSQAGVRSEVPVVLAEMRERTGPANRVYDATRELYYQGQLLASRAPIGTEATLTAANQASVRAFHARWYRPEQTVIVAAGDAEPAQLVALIEKHFASWRGRGAVTPHPDFGRPVAPADAPAGDPAPLDAARVLVEPDLPPVINYAIMRPWAKVDDTIVYNEGLLTDALALALINRRLEARARGGGSYLVAQVAQEDTSRSADGTFISITPLSDDWQAALADVRGVIADAIALPPTEEEIAREAAEFDIAFNVSAETAPTLAASKVVEDIVTAVDIRETVASPDVVLGVFRNLRPRLTPERVLDHTRRLFTGTVSRALMVLPTAAADDAALASLMRAPATADGSSRLAASTIRFDELPPVGAPGRLVSTTPLNLLDGMEVVTFSNGVRAVLWPNDAEVNKIMVKVRFGQGTKSFSQADAPYLWLGEAALVSSGLGSLGQEDLDRLATGRRFGFNFEAEDGYFALSADTRPDDLADQLYLFAAKLAMPRWDANPMLRAKAAVRLSYPSFQTSASTMLDRDLEWLLRSKDARFKQPSPADLAATTPERFRFVWEPILSQQGPVEVLMFGDFDREEGIAMLEKTFGALPARTPFPPAPEGEAVKFPAADGSAERLLHSGDPDQGAAVIAWPTGGGRSNVSESRQLYILSQLFNNRLFDKLRESAGASYSPQVFSNWPLDFSDGGYMIAIAQLKPESVQPFYQIAEQIASDLIARPPGADELARVVEPLRQTIERASTGNGFWLQQLEGVAFDRSRVDELRSFMNDYTVTTPAQMQALAGRYLGAGKAWKLEVLPGGEAARAAPVQPASAPEAVAGR